jgi:polyhydroxyalkanoate synthesis regulator phasin
MTHDTKKIEQDVQAAIAADAAAITERVRKITLQALSDGELDGAALKQVMEAVVKGARQGISRPDEKSSAALKDAMRGLDEALAAAATATHLAVQEVASRSNDFSRESLKQRVDELSALESQFIATLGEAAKQSTGHVQATLRDIASHAQSSGTAVGGQVKTALEELAHAVAGKTREQAKAGAETLRQEASLLAGLAAGVLRGIADRLQPPDRRD